MYVRVLCAWLVGRMKLLTCHLVHHHLLLWFDKCLHSGIPWGPPRPPGRSVAPAGLIVLQLHVSTKEPRSGVRFAFGIDGWPPIHNLFIHLLESLLSKRVCCCNDDAPTRTHTRKIVGVLPYLNHLVVPVVIVMHVHTHAHTYPHTYKFRHLHIDSGGVLPTPSECIKIPRPQYDTTIDLDTNATNFSSLPALPTTDQVCSIDQVFVLPRSRLAKHT